MTALKATATDHMRQISPPRAKSLRRANAHGACSSSEARQHVKKEGVNPKIGRRDLLRVLAIGAAAASTSACSSANADKFPDKAKAHYQADSPEVQTFYRVNRYPPK
jgi:hypothetical protein